MNTMEVVLLWIGVVVVTIVFNVFIGWMERRDAREAVREVQVLRKMNEMFRDPDQNARNEPR